MNRDYEIKFNEIDKILKLVFDCISEYDYTDWAVFQYTIEDLYTNTIYYVLDSLEIPKEIICSKFEINIEELKNILVQTYYNINLDSKYILFYNKVKNHLRNNNYFII